MAFPAVLKEAESDPVPIVVPVVGRELLKHI